MSLLNDITRLLGGTKASPAQLEPEADTTLIASVVRESARALLV